MVTARVDDLGQTGTVPWAKPFFSAPQAKKNLGRKAFFFEIGGSGEI